MHWYNAGLDGRVQEQSQLYQPCEPPFVEPAGEELETLDVPQTDLGFFSGNVLAYPRLNIYWSFRG